MSDVLRHDEPCGTAFSQTEPFSYIITKKGGKRYITGGAPVELLLYYRIQSSPFASYFTDLLITSKSDLESLEAHGPFRRIWIFDFAKNRILWQSDSVAGRSQTGETTTT